MATNDFRGVGPIEVIPLEKILEVEEESVTVVPARVAEKKHPNTLEVNLNDDLDSIIDEFLSNSDILSVPPVQQEQQKSPPLSPHKPPSPSTKDSFTPISSTTNNIPSSKTTASTTAATATGSHTTTPPSSDDHVDDEELVREHEEVFEPQDSEESGFKGEGPETIIYVQPPLKEDASRHVEKLAVSEFEVSFFFFNMEIYFAY
jgi:hypothetical protein